MIEGDTSMLEFFIFWEITVIRWEDKSYPLNKMTFSEIIVLLVDMAAVYN